MPRVKVGSKPKCIGTIEFNKNSPICKHCKFKKRCEKSSKFARNKFYKEQII